MIALLIGWLLNAIALYVTCYYVPGLHIVSGNQGYIAALIGAVILTLINLVVRPLLFILTLPINILTLGLFSFVILGLTFWLMTAFTAGISSDGLIPSIIGAVIFSILNSILHLIFEPEPQKT